MDPAWRLLRCRTAHGKILNRFHHRHSTINTLGTDCPHPSPLTHSLTPSLSCKQNFSTVFINQAGIAVANTRLLIPMLVVFILFLLQLFQQLSGSAIPYKYSDARKQNVIDKLAITLLLHQDKAIVYNEGTYSLTHSFIHSFIHSLTHLLPYS